MYRPLELFLGTCKCVRTNVPTRTDLSVQVQIFVWIFFKNTDFWTFVQIFFLIDHFYSFHSLILFFCKLCEYDAICCKLYRWLVSKKFGIDTIDTFATKYHYYRLYRYFFLVFFFNVRLRFRRMDNLFFVKKNLIKVSCVPWKYFLLFSKRSAFLKSNFSENVLKSLVQVSVQFYLSIAQILHIVYPKFLENFLIFVRFPHISFNISSHLNIFAIS